MSPAGTDGRAFSLPSEEWDKGPQRKKSDPRRPYTAEESIGLSDSERVSMRVSEPDRLFDC